MHCELIVPGLFAGASGTRAPALELLLARGRTASAESRSLEDWLQEGFGLADEPLAAGALTLAAAGGDPGEACWARADPVHLRLMRDHAVIVPGAAFALTLEEAEALAEALNRHFAASLFLNVVEPGRWCARLEERFAVEQASPLEAAGREVDVTTKEAAGLLNEIQMLLHAHPVNEAREARGEPPVNSLWLWGAGAAPRVPASRWQSVSANDPVALGLARLAGTRPERLPPSADAWLERAPHEGCHLVVLDALRAPLALGEGAAYTEAIAALERRWFAPLLAALRAGRVGMITVHVPDSLGASFEAIRGDLRRFWRRARALETYA